MHRPHLLAALLLAACASTPEPPPVVEDPGAEPMRRVSPEGFEPCLAGKTTPYIAEVQVELETAPDGFVTDSVITRSSDPCFNQAVLDAVAAWRYPPKLVDGVLAARTGIRAVFVFRMEEPVT